MFALAMIWKLRPACQTDQHALPVVLRNLDSKHPRRWWAWTASFLSTGMMLTGAPQEPPAREGRDSATRVTESGSVPESLASLVDAERRFARRSVEAGMRQAFLDHFAEEGLSFQPEPVRTRETLLRQAALAPGADTATLRWSPTWGVISRSGDFGFTSGPYVWEPANSDPDRVRHGWFTSVWRRQNDGLWKVEMDVGVPTLNAVASLEDPFVPGKASITRMKDDDRRVASAQMGLLQLDRRLLTIRDEANRRRTWLKVLDEDIRLYRPQSMPLIGRRAASDWLRSTEQPSVLVGTPIDGKVSADADLGYTFGRYGWAARAAGEAALEGYYVRLWRRARGNAWRLLLEARHPASPN